MAIQVLPGEPMRPYYVCVPERRCDRFDLRVRFDRRRPPAWVRRVVGEDLRVYESFEGVPPLAVQVQVDGTGEATASFSKLKLRQGYGLQWLFPRDEPSAAEGQARLSSRVTDPLAQVMEPGKRERRGFVDGDRHPVYGDRAWVAGDRDAGDKNVAGHVGAGEAPGVLDRQVAHPGGERGAQRRVV